MKLCFRVVKTLVVVVVVVVIPEREKMKTQERFQKRSEEANGDFKMWALILFCSETRVLARSRARQ